MATKLDVFAGKTWLIYGRLAKPKAVTTKAITPSERERLGATIGAYFLPSDPAGALEAFEAMSGKAAQQQWLARPEFFVDPWSAVLASAPPAS